MSNLNQLAKAFQMYTSDYEERFPCTRPPRDSWNGDYIIRTTDLPFTWVALIDPYVKQGEIVGSKLRGAFVCPEQDKVWRVGMGTGKADMYSYGYNFLFLGLPYIKSQKGNPYAGNGFDWGPARTGRLENPAETVLLVENMTIWAFPPYTYVPVIPPTVPTSQNTKGAVISANAYVRPRHANKTNVAWCDGHTSVRDTRELVASGLQYGNKTNNARLQEIGNAPDNRLWDRLARNQ